MKSWLLTRKVRRALVGLGSDPDEVAESLRAAGVKGLREKPLTCPIAGYLTWVFPGRIWSVGYSSWGDRCSSAEGENPPAVREFIRVFDKGGYPDLNASLPRTHGA